jgi:hypothetical protein
MQTSVSVTVVVLDFIFILFIQFFCLICVLKSNNTWSHCSCGYCKRQLTDDIDHLLITLTSEKDCNWAAIGSLSVTFVIFFVVLSKLSTSLVIF